MSTDTRTLHAACLCGSAKYPITLPSSAFPLPLHLCHCNSCRHMTGTLALTVAFLPEEYKPEQETLDKLVPYKFSKRITQYHCKTCGTQMLAHCWRDGEDRSKGSSWDAVTGTLDQVEALLELKGHEHIADTLDGGFADFLTVYQGKSVQRWNRHPGEGEQLPLQWESSDRPKVDPTPTDRLHAHCKCGGVEFWIARPSERSNHAPNDVPWWIMDDGKKYLAGVCSCNSCRLHTGMEWVEWAFVPVIDITLDKEGNVPFSRDFGTLKGYRSSDDVLRYHCDTCGATAFFFGEDRPHIIDVSVGLLDAAEGARAESWLEFWCKRLSYREDAMPRAESLTLAVEESLNEHLKWKYPHQRDMNES